MFILYSYACASLDATSADQRVAECHQSNWREGSLVEPSWRGVEDPNDNPDGDREAEHTPNPIRTFWEAFHPSRSITPGHEAQVQIRANPQEDRLNPNYHSYKNQPPAPEGGGTVEVPEVEAQEYGCHVSILGRGMGVGTPGSQGWACQCAGITSEAELPARGLGERRV